MQHITYNEWLPIILGPRVIDIFELNLLPRGHYQVHTIRSWSPFSVAFEKLMRLLELVQFLDCCNASESLKKWHTLNQGYNASVNPTIANVFGAAAFRWSKKNCFSFFFRHVMNLEFQKKKKKTKFFLLFLINIYRLKLRLQVWPLSGEE